jgi:hypothetical protein
MFVIPGRLRGDRLQETADSAVAHRPPSVGRYHCLAPDNLEIEDVYEPALLAEVGEYVDATQGQKASSPRS